MSTRSAAPPLCAAAVVALMLACSGGGALPPPATARPDNRTDPPKNKDGPEPADWKKAGATAKVADLQIEALWAAPLAVTGQQRGALVNCGTLLVAKLRIKNTSAAKLYRLDSWHSNTTLADEHGNNYESYHFGAGFAFNQRPVRSKGPATAEDKEDVGCDTEFFNAVDVALHPGKCYVRFLFFEKPVDAAKEARITLQAEEVGEKGTIRLRVPISR